MNRPTFIKDVKKFDVDKVKKSVKKILKKHYTFNQETLDKIVKSYRIAGILANWLTS